MSKPWPQVRLGEVLRHRHEFITIDDLRSYKRSRVQLHAQGIVLRDEVPGALIKTKRQQVCRTGEFLVAEIDAKVGGFGIVPEQLNGAIVSSHYFLFVIDDTKVDRSFLDFFIRTAAFLRQVTAQGSTNYAAIRPAHVLGYEMALPPLTEQRRVVARIEGLAARIHEIRELRQQTVPEAAKLVYSECEAALAETERNFSTEALAGLVDQERGISYGIVQTGQDVDGGIPTLRAGDLRWFECNTTGLKRVAPEIERRYHRTRLQGGELLLRIRGGVGALAVCPPELAGSNVSREIAVIPLTERINPRFAMYLLAAPSSQERMAGHVKGTSYVGINLKDVRTLRLPLAPLPHQLRVVARLNELQAEVDALKCLQAESSSQLNALLPAILDRAFAGELLQDGVGDFRLVIQPSPEEVVSRRAAIACYIVEKLHASPTFGRTQLMKALYLAEAHTHIDLHGEYERQAAGPFDKSIYAFERAARKYCWFDSQETETRKGHTKIRYIPLPNLQSKASEGGVALGRARQEVDRMLALFREHDTKEMEIIATLYAAWNDLILWGREPEDDAIVHEILDNWHEAKRDISEGRWRKAIDWMRKECFVPSGFGKPTNRVNPSLD